MTKIINLRQARKDRAKAERRAQANANAARFGEAKAPRAIRKAEKARAEQQLDAHRRDD